ncbi:MAG: hypothetical protein ACLP59_13115 [Bryobacteraceae bacterium]
MDSIFEDGKQLQPWWRGRSWRFWLTVCSPLLIMGACGVFFAASKHIAAEAEREAAVFHRRVAAGEYDAIYDTATPAFQLATNRYDSARILASVRLKMGDCKTPAGALGAFTNMSTSGTTVRLNYKVACVNGNLDETLTYLNTDFGPRLLGYNFRSAALLK